MKSDTADQQVVVVGGGFAGRRAMQLLAPHFHTVLIDAKGYFEYTPANLRCMVEPEHAVSTVMQQCKFTSGAVIDVVPGDHSSGGVIKLSSGTQLSFDFCVLCCGSDYAPPIKGVQNTQANAKDRRLDYCAAHNELAAAHSVLVVGGGDVAVELAAEIVGKWGTRKLVTIVTSQDRVLSRMPPAASRHAAAWLRQRGVKLILGQRASPQPASESDNFSRAAPGPHCRPAQEGTRGVVLGDGRHLTADLLFWCTGERPCPVAYSGLLAATASNAHEQQGLVIASGHAACGGPEGRDSQLHVLPTLQVAGAARVFVAGDCALPAGERTAFAADLSAGLAARNVIRLASGQPLLRFPEDACHGSSVIPKIAAVSLYKMDGVLQFNRLVLRGLPAAAMKWLVEHMQVHAARGSSLHTAAWGYFEAVGVWLGARLFLQGL